MISEIVRIKSDVLPKLDRIVKELVNNGVTYLFEIYNVKYLLRFEGSDKKSFILDSEGKLLKEGKDSDIFKAGRRVLFSDIPFPPSLSEALNKEKKEMKKYSVHIPKIYHKVWEIEAESKEEAISQIFLAENDEYSNATFVEEYYHDEYDSEHWLFYPQEEKEYIVSKAELHYSQYKVKAKNPDEAERKADNLIEVDPEFMGTEFSHEMEKSQWVIEEIVKPIKGK